MTSKKKQVLSELFNRCVRSGNFMFSNVDVREVAEQEGFGNPFDATKVDTRSILPLEIMTQGYCVVHLGKGKHEFIKAVDKWYHDFENIGEEENISWNYRPSLLNHINTSESNAVSLALNQGVLRDFLYEDNTAHPKIYLSHRTKLGPGEYSIGGRKIHFGKLQVEIDCTLEYNSIVSIIEAKNGFPSDFAVYQLFLPFYKYTTFINDSELEAKDVNCCYLLQKKVNGVHCIRLYKYTFTNSEDIGSISLVKKRQYTLVHNVR